jgi:hypothetical protein
MFLKLSPEERIEANDNAIAENLKESSNSLFFQSGSSDALLGWQLPKIVACQKDLQTEWHV